MAVNKIPNDAPTFEDPEVPSPEFSSSVYEEGASVSSTVGANKKRRCVLISDTL
jgi:hypothetical protein